MISISTNPIKVPFNQNDFNLIFSEISSIKPFFIDNRVKILRSVDNRLSFLLKRVAIFEFEIQAENSEKWVQLNSIKKSHFKSAIRFEYLPEENTVQIHLETDTNVFMELFLERRLKKLVASIASNIQNHKL